jgi:hypothetical protein
MASILTNILQNDVITYRRLRRIIGLLGILLPVLLVSFSIIPFFKTSLQPSISHYYYSNLRELFTGILCAVGLFLIRYKGVGNIKWWKNDNLLTNVAGAMAIGIAFVPTNPLKDIDKIDTLIPYQNQMIGYIHYIFAIVLFLSFSVLSVCIFTLGQKGSLHIPKSTFNENNIYKCCGYSIIVFILLIAVSEKIRWSEYATLIFESLSLFSFGIAWLIKGRALGDKGKIGEKLYREQNV